VFTDASKKRTPVEPKAKAALNTRAEPEHNSVWQSLALRSGFIQPKLTISQTNDSHEREADQMADRVMRLPLPQASESKLSSAADDSLKAQRK